MSFKCLIRIPQKKKQTMQMSPILKTFLQHILDLFLDIAPTMKRQSPRVLMNRGGMTHVDRVGSQIAVASYAPSHNNDSHDEPLEKNKSGDLMLRIQKCSFGQQVSFHSRWQWVPAEMLVV